MTSNGNRVALLLENKNAVNCPLRGQRARAGVGIGLEDTEFGIRRYRALDLDGHRRMFAQHIFDIAPEQWGAVRKGGDTDAAIRS